MSELTLHLPTDLADALAQESRQANLGQEEVALDLLRRALAIRRFRSARKSTIDALGNTPPESEDDIFERIS